MENAPAAKGNADIITLDNSRRALPRVLWLPCTVAACLMAVAIWQAMQLRDMTTSYMSATSEASHLRQSVDLSSLHLSVLQSQDPAYATARIYVAWDPYQHRGVAGTQDLPAPPAQHNYQLWVLDPDAPAPVSAGLLEANRSFAITGVHTMLPGFAVTIEPSGGSSSLSGPILFAVAPSQ